MRNLTLAQIQDEVNEWSLRNFGHQRPHRPLLGIIEELCELEEALGHPEKVCDAVADAAIYMLDFCNKMQWEIDHIWGLKVPDDNVHIRTYSLIEALAHGQLKSEQGIRGGAEVHHKRMQEALARILTKLVYRVGGDAAFRHIVNTTWEKVRRRNWVENPNNAHEVAEAPAGSTEK